MPRINIKIAQLVVEKDIKTNLKKILDELSTTQKDELVVFLEAILNGYACCLYFR